MGVFEGSGKYESFGGFSDDSQSGLRADVLVANVGSDYNGNSEISWNTLSWSIRAVCRLFSQNYTNANITSDNTIGGNYNGTLGVFEDAGKYESAGDFANAC